MSISHVNGAAAPAIMSGASASMPPQQKMTNLFDQIDQSQSGTITRSQFSQAFQTMNPPKVFQQAGQDAVWGRLDPNGSGQVSQQDFVGAMKSLMSELRQPGGMSGAQTASAAAQQLSALGKGSVDIDA